MNYELGQSQKFYKRKGKEGIRGMDGKRNDTLSNRGLTDCLCGVGYISAVIGVVAQPLRLAETLFYLWFLCGPFAARGAKGEEEYP
jgi:hypothetical protein